MSADDFYSVEQTLQQLEIDEGLLKGLIKAGKLQMLKSGEVLQFRADQVEQLRNEMGQGEPAGITLDDTTADQDDEPENDPIEVVLDAPAESTQSKIRSFGEGAITGSQGQVDTSALKRTLSKGASATRCRTFHSKLTDASVAYMNNQVNEWVDSDPDIEIKFASSTIGTFEGKHSEQHLIVTVFY